MDCTHHQHTAAKAKYCRKIAANGDGTKWKREGEEREGEVEEGERRKNYRKWRREKRERKGFGK